MVVNSKSCIEKFIMSGKWQYLPRTNVSQTYKILNKSKFIIFDNTTLGYEALNRI